VGALLDVGGIEGTPGDREVVDEIAVLRDVGGEGAGGTEGGVEVVVVAGVVDDVEVGDDISVDAAATIAVDDVVDDEDGRGIGGGSIIGAVGEIENDAVAGGVGITHGVVDKAEMVSALAPEGIAGVAMAIVVKAAELEIGDAAGGEGAGAEAEDGRSVGRAGIDDVDGAVAVALVSDPGRGRAAGGRGEGGGEVISAAEEADDRARGSGVGGAGEGFGGRDGSTGIGIIAGGRGKEGAIGSGRAVAVSHSNAEVAGRGVGCGVSNLGGKGERAGRSGSAGEAAGRAEQKAIGQRATTE